MNTTYFARLKQLVEKNPSLLDRAVPLSNGVPDGWNGKGRYWSLVPEWEAVQALKSNGDFERFANAYKHFKLKELDPAEVVEAVGEDAILVCWEKDANRCHRSVVAEWLSGYLDEPITELAAPKRRRV
jgi:hypothetical protein